MPRQSYGDLSAARDLRAKGFSAAVGLECVHNLDVTARILLNGESNFCPPCDFKGLGVAKMSPSTTCGLGALQRSSGRTRQSNLRSPQKTSIPSDQFCFDLRVLLTTITASPIAPVSSFKVLDADVALLGLRRNLADRHVFQRTGATRLLPCRSWRCSCHLKDRTPVQPCY